LINYLDYFVIRRIGPDSAVVRVFYLHNFFSWLRKKSIMFDRYFVNFIEIC